jgi:phage shock protein PspC (stress-responsive transcriptional regulator)
MAHKKLYRDIEHSSIGGVASGLADFFDIDVTIFRVLFIITTIFGGGLVLYVILWIVVPPKPAGISAQAEVINDVPPVSDPQISAEPPKTKEKKNGAITGGLILIALGILFLINIFTELSFKDIWPIIVITLGVIIVISGFVNKRSKS